MTPYGGSLLFFLGYRILLGLENTMHDDERWVAF